MLKKHRFLIVYSLFFLLFVFTAGVVLTPLSLSPLDGLRGNGRIVENGSALFDTGIDAEEVLASPKKDIAIPLATVAVMLIVLSVFIVSVLSRRSRTT